MMDKVCAPPGNGVSFGDTSVPPSIVIPAQAGIQVFGERRVLADAGGTAAVAPDAERALSHGART